MKIALVVPEFGGDGGGIHTFYRPLVKQWIACGHECFVVVGAGMVAQAAETSTVTPEGVRVTRLGIERLDRWRGRFARYALLPELQGHLAASWALKEIVDALAPDVTELTDFGLQFAAWVADPRGPYVVQCHGSSGQIGRHDPMAGEELVASLLQAMEASLLPHVPALQTCSAANAQALLRETGARALLVPPAWQPGEAAIARDGSKPGVVRVFGRLQRWKGAETLLAALRELQSGAPACEWYGRDMPFGARNRSTAAVLSTHYPDVFGSRLAWHGPVPQHEVHALQATALCNVVPSLWDVFNFTAVEAMASGRPVICSRGAGASELVEHGVSGLLFDAGDAHGLARALAEIQQMPEPDRLQMARRAAEAVRERLDPRRSGTQRIQLYEEAVARFAPPAVPQALLAAVRPEQEGAVLPSWGPLDLLPTRALGAYLARRLSARLRAWRQA